MDWMQVVDVVFDCCFVIRGNIDIVRQLLEFIRLVYNSVFNMKWLKYDKFGIIVGEGIFEVYVFFRYLVSFFVDERLK